MKKIISTLIIIAIVLVAPLSASAAEFTPQSPGPFNVGDSREFRAMTSPDGWSSITASLIAQSEHANIWTADCSVNTVTAANAAAVAVQFDRIYTAMTSEGIFAPHAGVQIELGAYNLPILGDLGNDGKINILMYDILGDGGGESDGFVSGFFVNSDFFDDEKGNNLDMIHIDIGENQGFEALKEGASQAARNALYYTLAHEFQHMLFYMYFGIHAQNSREHSWFNEALSEIAGTFFSIPGQENINHGMFHSAMNSYIHPISGAAGDFLTFNGSAKSYGMSKLFGIWLYKTYGDDFLRDVYDYYASWNDTIARDYYFRFMETFAADGGRVKGVPTVKLYSDTSPVSNLWAIRPVIGLESGRVYLRQGEYDAFFNMHPRYGRVALPTLRSGESVSLTGTHEKFYRLEGGGDIRDSVIDITVPSHCESTRYYMVVPNDRLLSASDEYVYTNGANGADVFRLTAGDNRIVTSGRGAYLFISTFKQDVSARVSYTHSMHGDVNGDGYVTIQDVLEILLKLAGLENKVEYEVGISDALEILMFLAGLESLIVV